MRPTNFDAVIVGGGIVGTATAAACTRTGMKVALVERDVLGGGATAAGMGHIVVMDDSEAQFALTRYSQALWSAIAQELPAGVEYQTPGTLWLASGDAEMSEAERKSDFYDRRGVSAEILSARDVQKLEPNLSPRLAGGLFVRGDAVVYPPAAASYFASMAQKHGATVLVRRSVTEMGGGRVILDDGQELAAPHLINATGTWAPALTDGIPLKKRKGHLAISDRYPGYVSHQLVELGYLKSAHSATSHSVAFNVQPRKTGQVLIGSSRQYGEETSDVDQDILAEMLQQASEFLPSIGSLNVTRVWTGFRAATPDKLPLIGPAFNDSSVWLATGHEGLGITTSLGTAELTAAALSGRQMPISLDPYLPGRFHQSESGKEPSCSGKA